MEKLKYTNIEKYSIQKLKILNSFVILSEIQKLEIEACNDLLFYINNSRKEKNK